MGIGAIMYYGKGVLIPFVLAALIWYILKELRNLISRLKIGKRALPVWVQNILSFVVVFFSIVFSVSDFGRKHQGYDGRISEI